MVKVCNKFAQLSSWAAVFPLISTVNGLFAELSRYLAEINRSPIKIATVAHRFVINAPHLADI
jgi:hypothetical protein